MATSDRAVVVPPEGLPGAEQTSLPARVEEAVEQVLIPAEAIAERVKALADEIADVYASEGIEEILAVTILRGAFMFAADLGRALVETGKLDVRAEFISVATYGDEVRQAAEAEREVRVSSLPQSTWGRHVLLVEDILDQGFTLARVQRLIEDEGAPSVRICSLMIKELPDPTPEVQAIRDALYVAFPGFVVPDRWVVGYGTDAAGRYRMLPHVCVVEEGLYQGEG